MVGVNDESCCKILKCPAMDIDLETILQILDVENYIE